MNTIAPLVVYGWMVSLEFPLGDALIKTVGALG
jgi:hypothetical protein